MEATKKVTGKSVKKWLGNNAIIVLMLAVSLIVGIIHPNFFALANIINLFKNVSIRYIIALGIQIRLDAKTIRFSIKPNKIFLFRHDNGERINL